MPFTQRQSALYAGDDGVFVVESAVAGGVNRARDRAPSVVALIASRWSRAIRYVQFLPCKFEMVKRLSLVEEI